MKLFLCQMCAPFWDRGRNGDWVCAGVVLGVLRSMVRKKTLTLCNVELTLPTLLSHLPLPLIPLEALYQE